MHHVLADLFPRMFLNISTKRNQFFLTDRCFVNCVINSLARTGLSFSWGTFVTS